MCIRDRYAIEDVVKQALSYSERHNRKIVFAYLLLPGINDRPSDVRQLAKWFRGKKVMINVLQYNPTSNSRIKAPQKREIAVSYTHLDVYKRQIPIIERGGRFTIASKVLPTSSSGS